MYNNFSLLSVIGGLSKTLNIANQMIPLYKQVKPLLSSSNKILSNLQNIKKESKSVISNNLIKEESNNKPTFFL